jgi:hypothetical protein
MLLKTEVGNTQNSINKETTPTLVMMKKDSASEGEYNDARVQPSKYSELDPEHQTLRHYRPVVYPAILFAEGGLNTPAPSVRHCYRHSN